MHKEDGFPTSRIWLIGDSPPKDLHAQLEYPLDRRHPARHNIWTPVLDRLQQVAFPHGLRLSEDRLYVRNAVSDPDLIDPHRQKWDWNALAPSITELGASLCTHRPALVLSFGGFSCELVRRAMREGLDIPHKDRQVDAWTTKELGQTFRQGVSLFDPARVNHLPLLHVSIARGQFLTAHQHFCADSQVGTANYFHFAGDRLGMVLLEHMKHEPIWLRHTTDVV